MSVRRKGDGQLGVKKGVKKVLDTFVASDGATGVILYNASGAAVYVTPNSAGNALVASTTRP